MKTKLKIITALLIVILLTAAASAYVPKEYQTSPFMSSYDIYKVSIQHIGQRWANYNLEELMDDYSARPNCLPCLDASMERRKINEMRFSPKPIIMIQRIPNWKE